jgi:hypothetical protein
MAQEKLIEKPLLTISRKISVDVDTPYIPVMATNNENEVKPVDAANAVIEGILCQVCKAGDVVPIVVEGIVPVQVDAAVSRGVDLMTSSNGRMFACAKTSGTTYNLGGKAMTKATAALEFVSVQIAKSTLRIKA